MVRRHSLITALLVLVGAVAALGQNSAPMPLTLSQAIDLALKQNRDLKLAQLAVVDSEHKKQIARSDYYPSHQEHVRYLAHDRAGGSRYSCGSFWQSSSYGSHSRHQSIS